MLNKVLNQQRYGLTRLAASVPSSAMMIGDPRPAAADFQISSVEYSFEP